MKPHTAEAREERQIQGHIAAQNARAILKPGDSLRVTKCPGNKRWITFAGWSGQWIVSKSGIDDYHPINVDRLNGEPISFYGEVKPEPTPRARRRRVCHCPYCAAITPLDRKVRGEDVALTTCHNCYTVFANHQVASWLEDPL